MLEFMKKYRAITSTILSGFDRIVFRGILRTIAYPDGMKKHLSYQDVPRRAQIPRTKILICGRCGQYGRDGHFYLHDKILSVPYVVSVFLVFLLQWPELGLL